MQSPTQSLQGASRMTGGIYCEQLNVWLGGFESVLKKMTAINFDWLLSTYHTPHHHTRTVLQHVEETDDDDENDDDMCNAC